jgi:iron complex transport system permease protein
MILFFLSILFVRGQARKLELMNLGDLFARNLEVKTSRVTMMSLGVSLILTSVVVIHFGVFSFVGLVLPHIVRSMKFFKYSIRRELYFGPIICGIILLGLDLLCYQVTIYGAEFPVGMLSAVFGSFALITVLFRSDNMNS